MQGVSGDQQMLGVDEGRAAQLRQMLRGGDTWIHKR